MKKIAIDERLRPFSHTPGTACLIPGTCVAIQAFPMRLQINEHTVPLDLIAPVKDFTLQQDLEKNCVFVFGKAKEGFFKLRITGNTSGIDIHVEKGNLKGQHIEMEIPFFLASPVERLSLGSHKALNWDKPKTLRELLPPLFSLSQKIPEIPPQPLRGTARLLELPKEKGDLAQGLESFFKAAFTQILVPRLFDDQYQGLCPNEPAEGNPCFLIQEGGKMVRRLFFEQNQRRVKLLPQPLAPLDAGRLIGIKAPGIGEFDIEWSKKSLRRVILRASATGDIIFELRQEIKSFRINRKWKAKSSEPLLVKEGNTYYLDRFQK